MSPRAPLAVVFGCAGPSLGVDERAFFRDADPLGFILFARNTRDPDQVRRLVDDLREAVGRADAPVLVDQEGGRVARLGPPHWRAAPAAARFAHLGRHDIAAAVEAARLNARLMAEDMFDLGVSVDCAPVLDVPRPDADPIIGDRAHGADPRTVAVLGRAVCEGLLAGGVLPVIKHIPGHGRATVDSHKALPVVPATLDELEAADFKPFADLADAPWAMTAHVVYRALDPDLPATTSRAVVAETIRRRLGFDGVLISDDLDMKALAGTGSEKARAVLAAGCDLVLHCSGDAAEMRRVAEGCRPLDAAGLARVTRAEAARLAARDGGIDRAAALARLEALLAEDA